MFQGYWYTYRNTVPLIMSFSELLCCWQACLCWSTCLWTAPHIWPLMSGWCTTCPLPSTSPPSSGCTTPGYRQAAAEQQICGRSLMVISLKKKNMVAVLELPIRTKHVDKKSRGTDKFYEWWILHLFLQKYRYDMCLLIYRFLLASIWRVTFF